MDDEIRPAKRALHADMDQIGPSKEETYAKTECSDNIQPDMKASAKTEDAKSAMMPQSRPVTPKK